MFMFNVKTNEKVHWIGQTRSEMREHVAKLGQPHFRADQIYNWIYSGKIKSFQSMENIPKSFRTILDKISGLHPLSLVKITGRDSSLTKKFLFRLSTHEMIESVLMQEGNRTTACLSSQVGCAMDCDFCATAKMGFQKNLSVGEIVDQFLFLQQESEKKITNVVFMGMGEPFLNYARVIKAADLLNEPDGIDLGARRITISTVGIIPKIKQFAKEGHRYKLAISLNGTTQNQRLQTMPAAKKYPIHMLIDAAKNYYETAKRFPTFEYVLINNLNDRTTDAENLIKLIGNLPCKVNLIPYNEIGGNYKRPSHDRLTRFINALKNVPFTVTVRWSNGTEIDAGCGQLAVNAGGGVQS